jgi:hypothetical protein
MKEVGGWVDEEDNVTVSRHIANNKITCVQQVVKSCCYRKIIFILMASIIL